MTDVKPEDIEAAREAICRLELYNPDPAGGTFPRRSDVERLAAVIADRAARLESELADEQAKVERLEGRRREGRQLLRRLIKYVREDRAETPGSTRLARLTDDVDDYLNRTSEPGDILRNAAPPPEPATPSEGAKCGEDVPAEECGACRGTGESLAMAPGGENCIFPPCGSCNGTGRALSEGAKCVTCDGRGITSDLDTQWESQCVTCKGSGRAPGGKGE